MRRRSALSVIGGAVAAMATPMSFGAAETSIWRHWTPNLSLREKCIRAVALVMRLLDRTDMLHPVSYLGYVAPIGVHRYKVVVDHNSGPSKFLAVISRDEWLGLLDAEKRGDPKLAGSLFEEIEDQRRQSLSEILGLDYGNRELAHEVLTIAIGMLIGKGTCDIWANHSNQCYSGPLAIDSRDREFVDFSSCYTGFDLASLENSTAQIVCSEVGRVVRDLKYRFRLSQFRKIKPLDMHPMYYWPEETELEWRIAVSPSFPKEMKYIDWDVESEWNDDLRIRGGVLDSRIDTGFTCPTTGQSIVGDDELNLHHAYMWAANREPEFNTSGVILELIDTGDDFRLDVSMRLSFNKESLQNVIAFAVLKV